METNKMAEYDDFFFNNKSTYETIPDIINKYTGTLKSSGHGLIYDNSPFSNV